MGGSSAQGVPYDRWLSIGKIIAWKLQDAIPDRPIRLNIIARAGDTLEMQHKALSNLQRRPDLLVIYSGHNEFYSRLWWAHNIDHYVNDRRPARWTAVAERLERFSPLCVLISESVDKCRIAIPPPSDTGRSLVDVPNFTALEYSEILSDFQRRLEEMVSYAERSRALPVLILPPGNDAGFRTESVVPAFDDPTPRAQHLRSRVPVDERRRNRRSSDRDRMLSSSDRPHALLRGDAFPTGPVTRASRPLGRRLPRIRGRSRPRWYAHALPRPFPASLS